MKEYKKQVTSCLNCPNFIQFKSEENINRCNAVTHRKRNYRQIKVENISKQFPEWCPLDEVNV